MKRYENYKKDKKAKNSILTTEEMKNVEYAKYKIIAPTIEDKIELEEAFEHIHYSNIDTDYIAVNQLAHEYLNEERIEGCKNNIIVDSELFEKIKNKKG